MPVLTLAVDPFGYGPIVDLYVGVGAARRAALREHGRPVPPPQQIRALIDTGARISCVEQSAILALGLDPTGEVSMHTASTGRQAITALTYHVDISLAGEATGTLDPDLEIVAVGDLSGIRVGMLLGRDLLDRYFLVYNGPKGQVELAY
jgi:hypothetical protein